MCPDWLGLGLGLYQGQKPGAGVRADAGGVLGLEAVFVFDSKSENRDSAVEAGVLGLVSVLGLELG